MTATGCITLNSRPSGPRFPTMMNVSKRGNARLLASGLLLLAVFSSIGSFGHAAVSLPVQHDSLALTVNPDRSVGVAWNTTSSLGTLTQNVSSYFTPGYAIHSSSSFSQQSSAVVQTSTIQYQLPPPAVSIFNSISLTATQTGLTGSGSLMITTNVPTSTITATFSTSPTRVKVNATVQLHFSPAFFGGTFLANQTVFQTEWNRTFGNVTWTDRIASQIQNATVHFVTVTAFNGTLTSIDSNQATVSIGFVAVPSQTGTDFVTVLENILTPFGGVGLDPIIRSALNLQTGETVNLTYNGSTYTLTLQSTTTYVSDLDDQVNKLKTQYLQPLLAVFPAGTAPASLVFISATSIIINQMSTTSDLDLSAGTSSTSLKGLVLKPQTFGSNTNFTIPGLFQTIGKSPTPGVNFTLIGGSDSSNQVKIVVPADTRQPNSTTSNSATWTNLQDASTLSAVEFQVQPLPNSFLAFLVSPVGIGIEAIVAIAVIAAVVLYMAKRRATKSSIPSMSGPTPSLGLGLNPAPPAP
ncbi:hypothetical protein E6H12_05355 [Candidatus Bathyarchaeota archaeon]|nr:MAG: hypothetical protein E6H12_05355 [Candidatus Bathyarchaeota archaeon]